MVNRVLMNTSALSISTPGVDVLTAGEKDLIFSSDYMSARRFLTGSAAVAAFGQVTVNYGLTLNGYPLGIFYISINSSLARHPIIQMTTQAMSDQKEYRAHFGTSSVVFLNLTASPVTFLYAVTEVET